jgi:hypothetical protein
MLHNDHLPSMSKALGFIPSIAKKKGKEEGREWKEKEATEPGKLEKL